MSKIDTNQFILASDVDEALSVLTQFGSDAIVIAGGTWVMRSPIRQEPLDKVFVSLSRIKKLHKIELNNKFLSIGSMVSHDRLARAICECSDLVGLWKAASFSANPAIRRVATIGGNICIPDFYSADLVPSLMSLGAEVEVQSLLEKKVMPIDEYIRSRGNRPSGEIVTKIQIPRIDRISEHKRITLRKAGEYPIANLSVSLEVTRNHTIKQAVICVGSVENTARRWGSLENSVLNRCLNEIEVMSLAQCYVDDFTARDGVDAPAWYRLRVLPKLVKDAFGDLKSQCGLESA